MLTKLLLFVSLHLLLPQLNAQICSYGQLRLVGGVSNREGRLEMCFNNAWGAVCDSLWTDLDAQVACRQLGYSTTGATFQSDAYYGQGTGSVVLNNVVCRGNESTLLQCRHGVPGSGGCTHADDVGVYCPGDTCTNGTIRLVGGANYLEGRLEICFNNMWGTVCDDLWASASTLVACRQLGFTNIGNVRFLLNTPFGAGTGRIFLNRVVCSGGETSLLQCQLGPIGNNTCIHDEDISLRCSGTIVTPPNNTCTTNSIRLTGTSVNYDGRVELCYNNTWGTVCDDGWTTANARVVCRQLGYSAIGATYSSDITYPSNPPGGIVLDNTYCNGNENRLVDCTHTGVGYNGDCTHKEDVSVVCEATCPYGTLRLVGGSNGYRGRLEICINNVWGTVCDSNWNNNTAIVACRDLGYSTDSPTFYSSAQYGQGSGAIFLDNVQCTGTETTLLSCSHSPVGVYSCSHANDVGLTCPATIVTPSILTGVVLLFLYVVYMLQY